jgi:hypothetical protein
VPINPATFDVGDSTLTHDDGRNQQPPADFVVNDPDTFADFDDWHGQLVPDQGEAPLAGGGVADGPIGIGALQPGGDNPVAVMVGGDGSNIVIGGSGQPLLVGGIGSDGLS